MVAFKEDDCPFNKHDRDDEVHEELRQPGIPQTQTGALAIVYDAVEDIKQHCCRRQDDTKSVGEVTGWSTGDVVNESVIDLERSLPGEQGNKQARIGDGGCQRYNERRDTQHRNEIAIDEACQRPSQQRAWNGEPGWQSNPFRKYTHDYAAECADSGHREIDFTKQQHKDDPQTDKANLSCLQKQICEVARTKKEAVGNELEKDHNDNEGEEYGKKAKITTQQLAYVSTLCVRRRFYNQSVGILDGS